MVAGPDISFFKSVTENTLPNNCNNNILPNDGQQVESRCPKL